MNIDGRLRDIVDLEILEKAIQKAIDGGWLKPTKKPIKSVAVQIDDGDCYIQFWYGMNDMAWSETWDSYYELIFNHDFAKALWPGTVPGWDDTPEHPLWQDRLQEMVIAQDPIKYLGEHL